MLISPGKGQKILNKLKNKYEQNGHSRISKLLTDSNVSKFVARK